MAKAEVVVVRQKINKNYISSVGRRREAVARVRLYTTKAEIAGVTVTKGDILVNNKPAVEYFRFKAHMPVVNKFLLDLGVSGKYVFTSRVTGGGIESQLDALILGMARALDKMDPETFHSTLRQKGHLHKISQRPVYKFNGICATLCIMHFKV